jgi:FimV-like protein
MKATDSSISSPRDRLLRAGVLLLGLVVFGLLWFADKTNLENEQSLEVTVPAAVPASSAEVGALPPLPPDPQFDSWQSTLSGLTGAGRLPWLDSLVTTLSARNRYAYAADFAAERANIDSSLANLLTAGQLSQRATRLDYVQADSNLFQRYSTQAIRLLNAVVEKEPENEAALLGLGLALTESGQPQNSMQGIMTIRRVLEVNPENVEASYHLGVFSLRTGQYDKAKARFERVLALDRSWQEARLQLAFALIQLGDARGARPLLEQVLQEAENPEFKQLAREQLNDLP